MKRLAADLRDLWRFCRWVVWGPPRREYTGLVSHASFAGQYWDVQSGCTCPHCGRAHCCNEAASL